MTDEQKQLDENESELEKLRIKCDEYLNGWKRAKADFINLQNETAKERIEWAKYAAARTLSRFLPALDTLYAAASHTPELVDTVKKFEEFMRGEGVAEIASEGIFDPMLHEVISMEKKEGVKSGTITDVAQRGYKLHEQVLRPAKVVIAE